MLLKPLYRFCSSPSVLRAAQKYKDSTTQKKMHEFDQNEQQIKRIRNKINYYETMGKQSQAYVMIREFLFQQQQSIYQINYPDKPILPNGKWTIEEMNRQQEDDYVDDQNQTPAEQQNNLILNKLQDNLKQKFSNYYNNIGKTNYTFSVKQEVQKIASMTKEQFEAFMNRLQIQKN